LMFTQIKAGPDGRVYLRKESDLLAGFLYPNLAGSAAGFEDTLVIAQPGSYFRLGLPNAIPVIRRDTLHAVQYRSGPCFSTQQALVTGYDSTGWAYEWNTGATSPTLTVDAPG